VGNVSDAVGLPVGVNLRDILKRHSVSSQVIIMPIGAAKFSSFSRYIDFA
jgi:hypothetical protein